MTQLVAVVGPTGTGKSELAVRLAELLDGEVIGCDAIQVYRGVDVASAKPTLEQRRRVRHHLVDVADPHERFSLGRFVREAEAAIAAIAGRGKVPIVAGGTGLYLRGLLRGIVDVGPADASLRPRLRRLVQRHGSARLHGWLARLDPASAQRVAPGDAQRVTRALEIVLGTRRGWSERLHAEGTWTTGRERFQAHKIGLHLPPDLLAARLDARVAAFFAAGLVEEVRGLLGRGIPPDAPALKGIGYREVVAAIVRGDDPSAVQEEVARSSRRYAKRQRTWFRGEPDVLWLDARRPAEELAAEIAARVRG